MKNAVMMVPIPGMTPRRVPVRVQIRSETTRTMRKSQPFFSDNVRAMAS